jgi:hypothetical protein
MLKVKEKNTKSLQPEAPIYRKEQEGRDGQGGVEDVPTFTRNKHIIKYSTSLICINTWYNSRI